MQKSKLPEVGTTIFTKMSAMAKTYNAINLSQGFPNFEIDDSLKQIYREVSQENAFHQYAPMPGNEKLLHQVSKKIEIHYERKTDPKTEILITAGATQALFTIIQALIFPKDEVIVLDPSYDCYAPAISLVGGKAVHVNLNKDFSIDWNKINDAITPNTRAIIINNPHNPGGKILTKKDFEILSSILAKHPNLIYISDEVYEYITFEQKHISAHTLTDYLDQIICVSSFGKTFHVTGWKIGYLVAPNLLMNEIKKVHQFNVFSVNSLAQEVLARYLPTKNLFELGDFYQEKRDFFRQLMKESKFELLPAEGSYFQVAKYSEISSESDVDFAINLLKNHGVATIPISGFNKDKHDDKLIRFCFAKTNETLIKAAEKLCKI